MLRNIIIGLIVLVVALGGYGVFWYQQAKGFEQLVERSIQQYVAKVGESNPRAKIVYDKLNIRGFPLSPRIVIKEPRILVDDTIRDLEISLSKITVMKDNSDGTVLLLSFPSNFAADERQKDIRKPYMLKLNESPALRVSLVNKGEKLTPKSEPRSFAVVVPKQLILSFDLNELHRDISFDLAMMQLPVWQNVRYDISSMTSFFFDLLAEAASRNP